MELSSGHRGRRYLDLIFGLKQAMVIAIRHGETDWNAKGFHQGQGNVEILRGNIDVPLNAEGLAQVHTAAEKICQYPVEKVLSTPLFQRARQTRDIIAQICTEHLRNQGLKRQVPAVDAPEFAPYDPGSLSGQPVHAIIDILEMLIEVPILQAPGGGTYAEYFQNFSDAWQKLYAEYGGDESRAAVVVLFGNEFRALPAVLYGKPIEKYSQQMVKPGQFVVVN
jgi:broad specificity phosphatase PhoE